MKIAIVRGDFAAPWELQNFLPLNRKNSLTLFTGLFPVSNIDGLEGISNVRLLSPADVNLGNISRWRMGILNRVFLDAHWLFGLESKLIGYDIAHCAETYFGYTMQCLKAKELGNVKAVVSTVWENIPFNNERIRGRSKMKKYALEKVDMFLAVTVKAKKALMDEGCDAAKITVLRPGINTQKFRPLVISGYKSIPKDNNIRILLVSRIVKEKGIEGVISIFNNLHKAYKNLELIIAGRGPDLSILRDEVQRKKQKGIRFIGQIPYEEMPNLYSSCDIFIHNPVGSSSWNEQYGMVLIEAMASGLPIIALNSGSTSEVIGKSGLVVEEDELQRALLSLIKNKGLRKEFSEMGRKRAVEEYNSENYAKQLEFIYKTCLKSLRV